MSIREELLRNLRGYTPCGVDDETDVAAQMLNAFEAQVLHKAAEKIRNSKKLRDYTDDHMSDCNMAADLIDPEVKQ